MQEVDKDRDNRISLEDYRKAVYENIAWLQFLGQILPRSMQKECFMLLFTDRPYINNIETIAAAMTRKNRESRLKSILSQADQLGSITSFSSDSTYLMTNRDTVHLNDKSKKIQKISDGNYLTLF